MIGARGPLRGKWRGEYEYDPGQGVQDATPVRFELELEQSAHQLETGQFSGTCRDEANRGVPVAARVAGLAGPFEIRFEKRYEDPTPPTSWLILYTGIFETPVRAVGNWMIPEQAIQVRPGHMLGVDPTTGTWWMERA